MDNICVKSLLIMNEAEVFVGVLSIGDIQRAILKNISLERPVGEILRQNPKVASVDTSFDKVKSIMMQFRMEFLPVIDEQKHVVDIYIWDEV
ncbi:MAG TPA: CBS domain-containing protein, partial [Bacteroidales bacterium]|nr:CBS domain-containing protein [Bacteroidales bacterium]